MRPRLPAVRFGWDDHLSASVADRLMQRLGVVALVGDHRPRPQTRDQRLAAGDILALAWPEQQAHRVAQRVSGSMHLGAQAAR